MPRGAAASSAATVAHGDACGAIGRESINAGRNRRKPDRCKAVGGGKIERRAIARCQQFFLALSAAAPHRTDGVDDMLRRQPIAACDFGRSGRAAAEIFAFRAQLGPGRAMDRAVDTAAAEQGAVRGVDDGIELKRRDVGHANFEPGGADFGGKQRCRVRSSARAYHAHSACASARRSTVLFLPISSKCSSRKRRAARLPLTRSISKKS